ncbi:MAG TPA: depupylase/deamidase Dop [Chthoniobacteraceae bacterium]|nr:depupylase/deamidase Dop [Chthoniobacteraceae bacterium]
MKRVFGIETEYGITVEGRENLDVVAESIEIVRSYAEHGVVMKWDYSLEDPHQDTRGFRARELRQDTDEAAFAEIDRQRPLSFEEIKSDLVLTNGARFYNDHAHPEYSTPECTTLAEIVAHDKAGERILWECAVRRNRQLPEGEAVRLYKNNTDFLGHSFGCHDNYLLSRDVPWEAVVRAMVPFLVTRQLFAGAGKIGQEAEDVAPLPGIYQISQRSDFLSVIASIDTMDRRPIVNTRDEPHADRDRFRRFHGIIGDANMNEVATALKIGTTALVLQLIEEGKAPGLELADPVEAAKTISRDESCQWVVPLADGRTISAIDLQRLYLEAAQQAAEPDDDTAWVLREWEAVLDDLAADPMRCIDRVDWVAKKYLLSTFCEEEKLSWSDPWLTSLDLEYHNIDPEHGLYHELVRQGSVRRVVSGEQIAEAITTPPATTRAAFRGGVVARFRPEIVAIQWDGIVFRTARGKQTVSLASTFGREAVEEAKRLLRNAERVEDLWNEPSVV